MIKTFISMFALMAMPSLAFAQVTPEMKQLMAECMAIESSKPDSTRSGVSASEFCAAAVVIATSN